MTLDFFNELLRRDTSGDIEFGAEAMLHFGLSFPEGICVFQPRPSGERFSGQKLGLTATPLSSFGRRILGYSN